MDNQAFQLLLQNFVTDEHNQTLVKTCGPSMVQESTASLLTARAFAKAGNFALAWETLNVLLLTDDDDDKDTGFLPKYRYFSNDETCPYVPETTIPNWSLLSGTFLTALPLHATIVLDIFAWSDQSLEEVKFLHKLFDRLYRYHKFLATERIGRIWHPWESLMDVASLIPAMAGVRREMAERNWNMPFEIPSQVQDSYEYIKEVYEPSIYLLERHRNATDDSSNSAIVQRPFVMMDVAYAAVWAKANQDLIQMQKVLEGRHELSRAGINNMNELNEWTESAEDLLESLWSEEHQTYRSMVLIANGTSYSYEGLTEWDASNFVAMWYPIEIRSRVSQMALRLETRDEFDCGLYPLWTRGECAPKSAISPLLNFLVSTGLENNNVLGVSQYIANSTVNLVCGLQHNHESNSTLYCSNATPFATFYDTVFYHPYNQDACSLTSTTTAAVVYNLLKPSPELTFQQDPLQRSGVIAVIFVDVIVAFGVGLGCLLLSLNLLRITRREIRSTVIDNNSLEGLYYSAAGSFLEEQQDDAEEVDPLLSVSRSDTTPSRSGSTRTPIVGNHDIER